MFVLTQWYLQLEQVQTYDFEIFQKITAAMLGFLLAFQSVLL